MKSGALEPRTIPYCTRDGAGNDIVAEVKIKQYEKSARSFCCPVCGRGAEEGVPVKNIVSADFTDWQYVGEFVCPVCADLFSLLFYSYICDPDGIRVLNVRELRGELTRRQKPPFLFCITTSRKKHLFYRARWNESASPFAVNLETETIYTAVKDYRLGIVSDNSLLPLLRDETIYLILLVRERIQRERFAEETEEDDE